MVPSAVDAAMLLEHRYADTNDLDSVLYPQSFDDQGGYKPIEKYGLGHFNYMFARDKCVLTLDRSSLIRAHIFRYANFYFFIWAMGFVLWCFYVFRPPYGTSSIRPGLVRKKNDLDLDMAYHHVKV